MNGKIIRIADNDVYGNTSDRTLSVFAVFNHLKYMNKYIIFTYTDELANKKLYYGSVHIKDDSLIVFAVNDSVLPFIDTFTDQYLNDKVNAKEYEIIDISGINKVQLVSSSNREYEQLKALDDKSIKKEVIADDTGSNNNHGGLKFLLVVIMLLLVGVTYLYLNPGLLEVELKELKCDKQLYHNELEMRYVKELDIKFDKEEHPIKLSATETYKFMDEVTYNNFKNGEKQNEYFKTIGEYKYNDNLYQLKIFYDEKTIIDNYNDILSYFKKEGYTCQEGTYYE